MEQKLILSKAQKRQLWETLQAYLDYGFTLFPINPDDSYGMKLNLNPEIANLPKKEKVLQWCQAGIKTRQALIPWLQKGIYLFRIFPAEKGLIVIDLDRHGGKYDGVKAFINWNKSNQVLNKFPINGENNLDDRNTMGYWVNSAGGGLHLYFKAQSYLDKDFNFKKSICNCESCEVKVYDPINIGYKYNGNPYYTNGTLAAADDIPYKLADEVISLPTLTLKAEEKIYQGGDGNLALYNWYCKNTSGHTWALYGAKALKKAGLTYDEAENLMLNSDNQSQRNDKRDTIYALRSVFNG